MKYSKTTPILAALMLAATVVPAYALDINVMGNLDTKVQDGRMYKGGDTDTNDDDKNDDRKPMMDNRGPRIEDRGMMERDNALSNRVKAWAMSAGTIGKVTVVAAGSLTIQTATNEIFTVTTTDAVVRRGEDSKTPSPIVVGDIVYVFGVKNGTTIAASAIIVGKTKDDVKPNAEEKRQAYLGSVTAKTDTSLTILGQNNISYTVTLASDAQIFINKEKQPSLARFVVGDNVMVQGTLSGTSVVAKSVIAMHLPAGTIVGKVTVVNGTTLTVLGSDNKTYTVLTSTATLKAKGSKSEGLGGIAVGDTVMIKGDLNSTNATVTATLVTEEKVNGNFFHRFGLFVKGIFGKK